MEKMSQKEYNNWNENHPRRAETDEKIIRFLNKHNISGPMIDTSGAGLSRSFLQFNRLTKGHHVAVEIDVNTYIKMRADFKKIKYNNKSRLVYGDFWDVLLYGNNDYLNYSIVKFCGTHTLGTYIKKENLIKKIKSMVSINKVLNKNKFAFIITYCRRGKNSGKELNKRFLEEIENALCENSKYKCVEKHTEEWGSPNDLLCKQTYMGSTLLIMKKNKRG